MKVSKKTQRDDSERSRAKHVDSMITYLECGDFVPPVKEFFPVLGSTLIENRYAMGNAYFEANETKLLDVPTMGIIFSAEGHRIQRGDIFRADVCRPVTRAKIEKIAKWIAADVILPRDAVVCQVVTHHINKTGSFTTGIPSYFINTHDKNLEGDYWFPLVPPSQPLARSTSRQPGKANFGEYHKMTAGGYRIGQKLSSGMGGFVPGLAASVPQILTGLWSIRLGAENGRSELIIPASEDGVCEFYRLRSDPLTATGRRAALKHYVREHLRKPKPVTVRAHFRGAEEFEWFGLKCRIAPPEKLAEELTPRNQ